VEDKQGVIKGGGKIFGQQGICGVKGREIRRRGVGRRRARGIRPDERKEANRKEEAGKANWQRSSGLI